MRKILFNKIRIENFLSVGNEPVELQYNDGINIITGANLDKEDSTNGIGKSTIVEALYFALFGTTLRDIKVKEISNYSSSGRCLVTLWFTVDDGDAVDEYIIERSANPSKVHLTKNGEATAENSGDITKSTIAKTNQFIQQLIRANQEVFYNSVIMSANNAIPFMAQRKLDKRKFLEGILGLGVFGDMSTLCRQSYNDCKQDHSIYYTKQQENQLILNKTSDDFAQYKSRKKIKIANLKERIDSTKQQIDDIKSQIKTLEKEIESLKQIDSVSDIDKKLSKLSKQIDDIKKSKHVNIYKREELDKKIAQYEALPDVCSECNRPTTQKVKTDFKKIIKKLIKEKEQLEIDFDTNYDYSSLEESRADLKNDRDQIIQHRNDLTHKKSTRNSLLKSAKTKAIDIQNLVNDIKHLNDDDDTFIKTINEYKEKISIIKLDVNKLEHRLKILNTVKFVVSEEGIRSFVVKKILKVMNGRIDHYLKKLDANCTLTFNEYFNETLINEKGRECSYHNFSSGEQKRIDLAVLFTFQDLRRLQSNVILNIAIYDELLDSSLDNKGRENVMKILNERSFKYNERIYIVTHRPDAVEHVSGDVIFVEKENGVTRIAQ